MWRRLWGKSTALNQVGISLSLEALTFVHLSTHGSEQKLEHYAHFDDNTLERRLQALKKTVVSENLQDVQTAVMLSQADYQIFLMECPKVPHNERQDAIRWQAAEYIDYPIEEAIVDYIELPSKAHADGARMLYIISTKKKHVSNLVNLINSTGLNVKTVDIYQNALRKIAIKLEDEQEGQALFHINEHTGHLIIFKDKTLYMMRDLNKGLNTDAYDLSIEIQKSLDYCASNLKNASVNRLVLTPLKDKNSQLITNLSNALGLPAREINFSEIIKNSDLLPTENSFIYTIALGAALSNNV